MRATIRDLLVADTGLTALIPTERWFQAGNVVDVPIKPFAILRWIAPVSGAALGSYLNQLQVQVFDNRGSYATIDQILGGPYKSGGVYSVLAGAFGVTGSDGYLAQADYFGDSGDQENLDFKANMKYSSWQIIGRCL